MPSSLKKIFPYFKKTPRRGVFYFLGTILGIFLLYVVLDSLSPHLPKEGEEPRFYSNQCQRDLRLTFLDAIKQAKTSVHLVMFGLSDPFILSALEQKARDGLEVNIYYDPKGSSKLDLLLEKAILHPIESSALMHQKILILDHEMVFIGSANMTTSSLRMHDNLMVGFKNSEIARFLEEKAPLFSEYLQTTAGGQTIEIQLLPDIERKALTALQKKIASAKRSLRIALFTCTHPLLIEEIIAAHSRGVEVSLIIDMHSGLGASAKGIQRMKEANIPIFMSQGIQLMHHKFVWIDEEILCTGSANWTKAAFDKNRDCLLTLYGLNAKQKTFMKKLWRQLKTEAKKL